MNKIPVPVVVVLLVVAVVALFFSIRRVTSGGKSPTIPTHAPNAEAMQHMRESGMQGHGAAQIPPGMGQPPGGPPGYAAQGGR